MNYRLKAVEVLATVLIIWFSATLRLLSQTVPGQINGTVTDVSGNVISGANVILKNLDTNEERTAVSAPSGVYFLASVPPGRYSLAVSAKGFKSYVVSDLTLLVNQAQTVNARLMVGAVTQTVKVQAGGVALDTTEATIGTVVGHQDAVTLPLNGRNFTELIQLTPGVAPIQAAQQNSFIITGGISPAVNGMRPQMNNFTLDGVDNNQRFSNTYAQSPPPDAIAEFEVASHETGADVSLAAGANINLVTRSGNNTFHGSLWEFLRNNDLDARNYFDNFFNTPTLPFQQNQFGYFLGGPVFLPHIVDGRKTRTYFSTYYEGFRLNESITTVATVPTDAERNGNFTDLLGPVIGTDCLGRPVQQGELYDITTTVANASCPGGFVRDPYPNNTIPYVHPVAAAYLKYYYPEPNTSTLSNNLVLAQDTTQTADQWGIRADQALSDQQHVYARASFYNWVDSSPGGLPENTSEQQNTGVNVAIHYTKVFSPTFLMDLLAGYNRSAIPNYNPGIGGATGAAFDQAVGPNFYNDFSVGRTPVGQTLTGSGFSSTAFTGRVLADPDYTYQYNGDFKKISGRHEMSFGFRYMRFRHITSHMGAVTLSYSPLTTDLPGFSSTSYPLDTTGEALVSLMLGYPTAVNQSILPYFNDWGNIYNGYFGDTWKFTKNLTINLGLQYVYASPPLVQGNKISLFDWQIAQTQPDATDFTYAYLWCATNPITGVPRNCPRLSIMNPDRKNFAPRVGVAYSLSPKTVVRAGAGLFYDFNSNIEQNSIRVSIGVYPYGTSLSVGGQNTITLGSLSLDNPYPSVAPGAAPIPGESIDPMNRNPYAIEYNFGIEQMIPWGLKLSMDYVGSGGRRLLLPRYENIAVLGSGSIDSRRPLHNGGGFVYTSNAAGSSYNALEVKLEREFRSGLTFLNSYTWSKSLDVVSDADSVLGPPSYSYDFDLSHGPSDFDLTNVNTTSLIYELPVGRGRRFAASAGRILDLAIGGWQASTIAALRSGQWSSVTLGIDQANIGDVTGYQTANRAGNPFTSGTRTRAAWFDTAAYQIPAFGTLGNSGRNSLKGPEYKDVDFALMKNFQMWEGLHLQFRSEFFNVFNHTNFGNPNTVATTPTFGQILSANSPREIQGALKLIW